MARSHFLNRELSWLAFNRRVLEEARDSRVPALERLKFLAIAGSNLDEFFMVRVGGLLHLLATGRKGADPAGFSPGGQLAVIAREVRRMAKEMARTQAELEARLRKEGLRRLAVGELNDKQRAHLARVFEREVFPVISPVAVRRFGEFPLFPGLTTAVAVRLGDPARPARRDRFAVLAIPRNLSRLVVVPEDRGYSIVLLEDLVTAHLDRLFPGEPVGEQAVFRITRDADMSVREDQAGDLLAQMREVLTERKQGACVRLQVETAASPLMVRLLRKALGVEARELYRMPAPLDFSPFATLAAMPGYDALREPAWKPVAPPAFRGGESVFETLARQDVLLVHPYESFGPVVRFIEEAADDPDVLAIKQILYRTSRESPVVAALTRAAAKGKHVTALVELKARFDEARNIGWAQALELAGVRVVYGVKNLKTHAKICIVVRREAAGVRRYLHFGTGNYNEITARLYCDVSYMTCHEAYGRDASRFFNAITGYSRAVSYERLAAAPLGLRDRLVGLIESEAAAAARGEPASIAVKINSLSDPAMIGALVKAAKAGVRVRLNVRGVCCLRPVAGIEVVSVVDRYLEHARILCFHQGGRRLVFISSADWMTRNMDKRIELLVPVEDPACKARLLDYLETFFRDTRKAYRLGADGSWERAPLRGKGVRAQEAWYEATRAAAFQAAARVEESLFEPQRPASRRSRPPRSVS
ncbi:MAG: polyphosphate kinase 1 [Kiritimatiellia bacterium]